MLEFLTVLLAFAALPAVSYVCTGKAATAVRTATDIDTNSQAEAMAATLDVHLSAVEVATVKECFTGGSPCGACRGGGGAYLRTVWQCSDIASYPDCFWVQSPTVMPSSIDLTCLPVLPTPCTQRPTVCTAIAVQTSGHWGQASWQPLIDQYPLGATTTGRVYIQHLFISSAALEAGIDSVAVLSQPRGVCDGRASADDALA